MWSGYSDWLLISHRWASAWRTSWRWDSACSCTLHHPPSSSPGWSGSSCVRPWTARIGRPPAAPRRHGTMWRRRWPSTPRRSSSRCPSLFPPHWTGSWWTWLPPLWPITQKQRGLMKGWNLSWVLPVRRSLLPVQNSVHSSFVWTRKLVILMILWFSASQGKSCHFVLNSYDILTEYIK